MFKKLSFTKSLLYCGSIFRKDKQQKIRENAMERFERPLDIRSFVSVYTDLALLVKLIFSDQQALLF